MKSKDVPLFLKEKRRASSEPRQIRKYLRYAIGEVILLVIGILIALQINNWNDERKDRKKELFYLETLKRSIQNSKQELTRVFEDANAGSLAADSLIQLIAFDQIPPLPVFDSLLDLSSDYSIYSADNAAIEEIISSGNLALIRNEYVRNQIASWESRMHVIAKFEQETKEFRQEFVSFLGDYQDITISYRDSTNVVLIPDKISELANHQRFKYHLGNMLANHYFLSRIYGSELEKLDSILLVIDQETRFN